ncbi:heavy metal-associated isoprenylated plant protein 16-like isoform X1 [Salvia miltiorrhiza]|uniref:heavy metal-associated isoprenylated plant protein 16-like isoform X1 n=1 Tax=Salvia miltiorrhiza TaxID=226208 RepID=UPI0025ACC5FC|nr:heavy metal-associated isoprenylated plant protein 16-like isoform X1 [Salvia miltiorrhiza]
MKKKIVINVPMHCDKAKSKAMKIAVAVQGVASVSIGANDKLEVVGEEVDSVCLVNCLRKKFCFADIISVAEAKPQPPKPPTPTPTPCQPPPYCHPLYLECEYDPPPPNCSIM